MSKTLRRDLRGTAIWLFGALLLGALALPSAGQAAPGGPAAIVEETNANSIGVVTMDFVYAGDTFQLGAGETLTLAYLKSCTVEVMREGVVTVGLQNSTLFGGTMESSEQVECDSASIVPDASQGQDAAGFVVRGIDLASTGEPSKTVIYSTYPVFRFSEATPSIKIERMDQGTSEEYSFQTGKSWIDLAQEGTELAPGGTYQVSTKTKKLVFSISDHAKADHSTILGRLVGL